MDRLNKRIQQILHMPQKRKTSKIYRNKLKFTKISLIKLKIKENNILKVKTYSIIWKEVNKWVI